MATHGLGEPDREDYDLYAQILRMNSRRLKDRQIEKILAIFYDPQRDLTAGSVIRDAGVSRPTATRYVRLLLAGLEQGPQAVLSSVFNPDGAIKKPSPDVIAQNERALTKKSPQQRKAAAKERDRLSADETSMILDRHIRRLDADPDSDPGKLKQLIDQKMKFEDMSNPGQDEIIDVRKVLGKEGMAGMNDLYLKRLGQITSHRGELPMLWDGIVHIVLKALIPDAERGFRIPDKISRDGVEILMNAIPKDVPKPETTEEEVASV